MISRDYYFKSQVLAFVYQFFFLFFFFFFFVERKAHQKNFDYLDTFISTLSNAPEKLIGFNGAFVLCHYGELDSLMAMESCPIRGHGLTLASEPSAYICTSINFPAINGC